MPLFPLCLFVCLSPFITEIWSCGNLQLHLAFGSQLLPKYIVVILYLKLKDAKNRNLVISLWEEPVKGRACNHGTPHQEV